MNQAPPTPCTSTNQRRTGGVWSFGTLLSNSVPDILQRRGAKKESHVRGQTRHLQVTKSNSPTAGDLAQSQDLAPVPYMYTDSPSPPRRPVSPVEEPGERWTAPTLCKRVYLSSANEHAPLFIKNAQKRVFSANGPVDPVSALDATAQLYRYVLDMLAFTLGVDSDMLNRALGQKIRTSTTTILATQERRELLHLSLMVQRLHARALNNQQESMLLADKSNVLRQIMESMADTGSKRSCWIW